ncbi:putative membrane protein YfcA [Bradyrhizobium sp. GM7.3]
MDALGFAIFALAALAGGFVSGFSGFAMGLVVSGVWLHIITPIQTATLIAGYGLLTQGYGIYRLRHVLDLRKAWPLALGTVIGIPIGVEILVYLNPLYLRFGVGVLLMIYSIYGLARPVFAPMRIGTGADIAIGISNGMLGGFDGARRRDLHDIVPMARLAEGFAAGRVSAGAVHRLRGHLLVPGSGRLHYQGNTGAVRVGRSLHGRRPLVRLQDVRDHPGRDLSQGCVGTVAVGGALAGRLDPPFFR